MATTPPLPLAQQIVAWVLRALGYAEESSGKLGISTGTLKNAKKGDLIPKSWEDLVNGLLKAIGLSLEAPQLASLQEALHAWDEQAGALPEFELSLPERLYAPLTFAIPMVGLRLGALAALRAHQTQRPIEDWRWVTNPFGRGFFGEVIHFLLERRFPDETNDQKKERLENALDKKIVDWRTIERWKSGDSKVPNVKALAPLGALLGPSAEEILRAARMAGVFRDDLDTWIGEEAAGDWAQCVAKIAEETARTLASRIGLASLLRCLLEDLDGPFGDRTREGIQPFLLPDMKDLSRAELSSRFAENAKHLEEGTEAEASVREWLGILTLLLPDLRLSMHVCAKQGSPALGMLGATDPFHLIQGVWIFQRLMKEIATGESISIERGDGRRVQRQISSAESAIAQRWCAAKLTFSHSARDPALDDEAQQLLCDIGGVPSGELVKIFQDPAEMFRVLLAPSREQLLPDEVVRRNRAHCLARARRLAKEGDCAAALQWLQHARSAEATALGANNTLELETFSIIGHAALDQIRSLRPLLQSTAQDQVPGEIKETLLGSVQIAEELIGMIMTRGKAPKGSHSLLVTLVAAIPVAIRVALLRQELGVEGEGVSFDVVVTMIGELTVCLECYGAALLMGIMTA